MTKLFAFTCLIVIALVAAKTLKSVNRHAFQRATIKNVLKSSPNQARLINLSWATGPISTEQLQASLIDNATLIRADILGGFDCMQKTYGYYADTNNGCQIFHVCVPMMQLFPKLYTAADVMQFSFICPEFTIFTQDAMVCAWERSAIPCEVAPELYYLNDNFFIIDSKNDTLKITDETTVTPTKFY